MKLPRRIALLIGAMTALLALFTWRANERADLPLLLAAAAMLLIAAGLVRPQNQAGRTRVVVALGIYAAAMLVAACLAWALGVDPSVLTALVLLLLAGVAATARAAYQAPRRRERIYARYLTRSPAEPR